MSFEERSRQRPPERLADRYRVQDVLGAGASAITYRGWDERLERSVAIKILRDHDAQDELFVRRFGQEARAAASISHGNVVDVYDVGREGDVLFIVMQLIEGEDLKRLIQREAPLERECVRMIIGQVLDGLQAIHAAGIVHRDIKPQNILIGRDDIVRVTDFGIAQAEDDAGMTTEGTTVGTAAYMAPEQAQAGRITNATDLYAVGVILYEMLTGFLPFNAPTTMALMLEHIQSSPMAPSQRLPGRGISSSIDAVVLRALDKNPAQRFQSSQAMKAAMNQALQGRGMDDSTATVVTSAIPVTRRSTNPQYQKRPAQGREETRPVVSQPAREDGAGLGGVVAGLALIVLLALAGAAAWYAWENWQGAGGADDPSPTATVPAVAPIATDAPTATREPTQPPTPTETATEPPAVIEPMEPTATVAPTATVQPTPTDEPTTIVEPDPTNTPFPTMQPIPTLEPVIIPTIPPVEIEPIGHRSSTLASSMSASAKSRRGNDEGNHKRGQDKDKNSNKKDDKKDKKNDKHEGIVVVESVAQERFPGTAHHSFGVYSAFFVDLGDELFGIQ